MFLLIDTKSYIFNNHLVWGLKLHDEVVDAMGLGCKLSVTKVILSNFEEAVEKFVFIVKMGSLFKWRISFGLIFSFDCLLKD